MVHDVQCAMCNAQGRGSLIESVKVKSVEPVTQGNVQNVPVVNVLIASCLAIGIECGTMHDENSFLGIGPIVVVSARLLDPVCGKLPYEYMNTSKYGKYQ